jgi:hypothetical protein
VGAILVQWRLTTISVILLMIWALCEAGFAQMTGNYVNNNPFVMSLDTTSNFSGTISCPANTDTVVLTENPGWTYVPGYSHMSLVVQAHVLLCNATASDDTGVYICIGTGNCGPKFTIKANSCLDAQGWVADGFTPPTTFVERSIHVYLDNTNPSTLTAYGGSPHINFIAWTQPY